MTAFYNEIDPYAAQWLRNLIAAGAIAPGVVDERSVWDIAPEELDGFTQCHFFAGIGVWSRSLRRAGWPDDRPVWTASCPCQPFSVAGESRGFADERHAWPAVLWLVQARQPRTLFGEQVSSKDGLDWFDVVQADLDREGYIVGGLDTCAASVSAPHRRQRLYFVADSISEGLEGRREEPGHDEALLPPEAGGSSVPDSFWSDAEWVRCDDPGGPRWRPIEPRTFPLADGPPAFVGRLRAYGNALCAQQASEFVTARMQVGLSCA
ncbi:DNA cytosine methyltransferase [bacterium]|nr:DNA cytosine methyltransferase [bacterium]